MAAANGRSLPCHRKTRLQWDWPRVGPGEGGPADWSACVCSPAGQLVQAVQRLSKCCGRRAASERSSGARGCPHHRLELGWAQLTECTRGSRLRELRMLSI